MDDLLAKLPDADAYKALGTLEAVRRELKARGGDAFMNNRLLLSALQRRLASARSPPTEELAVAALLVLTDFAGCMDVELLAGVPAVFSETVPLLGKDGVRRAAGTLVAALLRRGLSGPAEASLAQAIITRGLKSDSVSRPALQPACPMRGWAALARPSRPSHPRPPPHTHLHLAGAPQTGQPPACG